MATDNGTNGQQKNVNGKVDEPYVMHTKQAKEQIEKLEMQRLILLGQVHDLERGIEYLRRHVGQLDEIDKQASTNG